MASEKILYVDDDPDMQDMVGLYMKDSGFIVFAAEDGFSAMEIIKREKPQLIILDVMMPDIDGFELSQYIRKETSVPILFFSTKVADADKILGLGLGGDDYISKTTSLPVLVAKVKAHLRRNRTFPSIDDKAKEQSDNDHTVIQFPGLIINLESAVVKLNDSIIKLSAKEYRILCLLAQTPERIFNVEQIFDQVWDEESLGDNRTVMVHISNLRKKIELNPEKFIYIQTFRGIGYKFNNFKDL